MRRGHVTRSSGAGGTVTPGIGAGRCSVSRSRFALRKPNQPPQDEPWVWFTREMLESPAWAALSIGARRIVDRIVLEQMAHGGTQNGDLTITYDDFGHFGLSSRRETARSIRAAVALGFIDITTRGRRSYGGARTASRYGLTWLPHCDRTPASNRWRTIRSGAEATKLLQDAFADRRYARREIRPEPHQQKAA
jgi:hypothetical protein